MDKKFWGGFDLAYMQKLKKENKAEYQELVYQ